MGPFEILLQVSPRRRSIGLLVTTEGQLVVKAPAGSSLQAVAQAVARHQDWLRRKLEERREALGRLQPGRAYFLGEALRVRRVQGPFGVVRRAAELVVALPQPGYEAWGLLAAWYEAEALGLLTARVEDYAGALKLAVKSVEVREWRRRWGECHPGDGRLRFNWRLVLLPPAIIDYVVVHELTHLKVPGHPPRFWQRLARVIPDWQERRAWLNREGAPFLTWRWEPQEGAS